MKSVSFDSELCKFGIGLFETIKVKDKAIDLDLHLDRMFNSIDILNLNVNYNKDFIKDIINLYIKENNIKDKALRITIFDKGYNISTRDIPYDKEDYNRGFTLNISSIKRGNSIIYKHKTTNYYENIYTKRNAMKAGYDDGIFLNTDDIILECSMSNIYFIKNNEVYTPSSDLPILNGTMKKRVFNACNILGINIHEKHIKLDKIGDYDFVFISNSLMNIMKVSRIEDNYYNQSNEVFEKIFNFIK